MLHNSNTRHFHLASDHQKNLPTFLDLRNAMKFHVSGTMQLTSNSQLPVTVYIVMTNDTLANLILRQNNGHKSTAFCHAVKTIAFSEHKLQQRQSTVALW